MASDFHIKIDGVDGESKHKDHKNEIEVLAWQWGVHNASGIISGGGSGKGKAEPGEFLFSHEYDKASPVLAKHCVTGKHFPKLVLTCRKSGDGQQEFLKITLKEVFVTSVGPSASTGSDVLENVTCTYKDVECEYKPQDSKGSMQGAVKFGWAVEETSTR